MATVQRLSATKIKTFAALGLGNALEWYDWHIYAVFAATFSTQFFGPKSEKTAFIATMLAFALGFVARPLGAVLFGFLGDHRGRRSSVVAAIGLSTLGLTVIAVAPPQSAIGVASPVLLIAGRLAQGLAHGAELPSVQAYVAEIAPRAQRNLYASAIYVTGTCGSLAAIALGLILNGVLDDAQMAAWGWRVPFALGALAGLVVLALRATMRESDVWQTRRAAPADAYPHRRYTTMRMIQIMGTVCGGTFAYYIWSVAMPSLAQHRFDYSRDQAFWASMIGTIVFLVCLPLFGRLADRIGHRLLIITGSLASAVMFFPAVAWITSSKSFLALTVAIVAQQVAQSAVASHGAMFSAELFATRSRLRGMAITYALPVALFGGTAGAVFSAIDNLYLVGLYGGVLLGITALSTWSLPETGGTEI